MSSDEDVRTWWSVSSGNKGEWLQMDLKKEMEIEALQISFSDDGFEARRFDKDKIYWINIEAFNESGRSKQSQSIEIKNIITNILI